MKEMRSIEGYEDYYITRDGEVWSKKGEKLKQRKLQKNQQGYYMITLMSPRKGFLVSRLVLATYKEKVKGKDFCNHIDGNKRNNNIKNLEWCTIEENNRHSVEVLGNPPLPNNFKGKDAPRAMRYTLSSRDQCSTYETLAEAVKQSGHSAYQIYNSLKYGNKLRVNYLWTKERIHPKGYWSEKFKHLNGSTAP